MGAITIIGTGFDADQLTLGAIKALQSGATIILHTQRCGLAEYLTENRLDFISLDALYDEYEDFDEHAQAAAEAVTEAAETGEVVYCVMDVRDLSAALLARRGAKVIPGPVAEGALMAFASAGVQLYAAADWEEMRPDAALCAIVREIDSRELASEVKLRLMEAYPDDARAIIQRPDGEVIRINLFDLDRQSEYDHRFSALVLAEPDSERRNDISMRDLAGIARRYDGAYCEGDPSEIAENLAKIAGAIAYAEDRGEFTASDMMIDARDVLKES